MAKMYEVDDNRQWIDRTPAGAQVATLNRPGVVIPGRALSVTNTGVLNAEIATATALGVVRPGEGLEIDSNGVLTATGFGNLFKVAKKDLTFYVRKTGSDSNDGFSEATAFLTIGKAVSEANHYWFGDFQCTIDIGAGQFDECVILRAMQSAQPVVVNGVLGQTTVLGGVVTLPTGASHIRGIWVTNAASVIINDIAIDTSSKPNDIGNIGFLADKYSSANFVNPNVLVGGENAATNNVSAARSVSGAVVTFSGTCRFRVGARAGSVLTCNKTATLDINASSLDLSGGTVVQGTVYSGAGGSLNVAEPNQITGSVTGRRYLANLNGTIRVHGRGENYFPGTLAGTVETGGQYA